MGRIVLLLATAAACGGAAPCFAGPDLLLRTAPAATVRFPAGNYGSVATRDGLAVTGSYWSREDTAGVFDFSDPAKPKFVARFPAKGYTCAPPVFFKDRCYIPNGFCASVIDVSDRKAPKFIGYLNPQFPKNGCRRLWAEDGELYFTAFDGNYRVTGDGLSFEKTDRNPPKPAPGKKAADPSAAVVKDSAVRCGEAEIPFVFNLASLAVREGTVWIYASWDGGAHLLPLSPGDGGLRTFGPRTLAAPLPRGRGYQTMGMQNAISVTCVGDLIFADDGLFRFGRKGKLEALLPRTRPASDSSVDGTRIALAQCTRCRVIDFTDPNDAKVLDVTPKTELPIHITGCNLRGNDLFLAYTLVESKDQDFIYKCPKKGYVIHVDLRRPTEASPALELPLCVALDRVGDFLYVTCGNRLAVVDARNPGKPALAALRRDIVDGGSYKVKTFAGRTFVLGGRRIAELDTADPAAPRVKRLYDRPDDVDAPGYDDFTVDGGRLYALAHASLDVFDLDDTARTAEVRNDCGENGMMKKPLEAADAAVFDGHVPNPRPPEGISFRAGRFGNCFGAFVMDWAKLPDGRYAVAYGEAGAVICDAKGGFAEELPRGPDGGLAVFATEIVAKDGRIFAKDAEGKAFALPFGKDLCK